MTAISHGKFSLDLRRKKGRFARFKQSLEVHWLSISLGYNLRKAYWLLVRCSSHYLQAFSLIFDRLSNYLFILCNLQARVRNDCSGNTMRVKSLRSQTINTRKAFLIYDIQRSPPSREIPYIHTFLHPQGKFPVYTSTTVLHPQGKSLYTAFTAPKGNSLYTAITLSHKGNSVYHYSSPLSREVPFYPI